MMRVCSASTGEGTIWPVDAALRPEGKAGPLVRTLASHVAYYERWAKTWEFQALLKARPVAGDLALGPGVRRRASRRWCGRPPSGRTSSTTCSRCAAGSRSTLPAAESHRELKLGPGGLRDVEFAVQLLQLVHGRTDDVVAQPATPSRRWRRCRPTATSVAPTPPSWTGPTGSCARSSTGCSCTGCAAPTSCPTTRTSCAGSAGRSACGPTPVEELDDAVAPARARGAAAAREALLPAAAVVGGAAGVGRGAAQSRGRAVPARGPGLRGPGGGAAPPRGAHGRGEPTSGHPADLAAGAARLVRRRAGPGRRAARLPAPQRRRSARRRGTSGCSATRARSRTGWRCCSRAAGTPSTCSAARPRRCGCSRTTRTWLLAASPSCSPRCGPRSPGTTTRRPPSGSPVVCAVASCSASRPPTCSSWHRSSRSRRRSPTSPP